MLHRPFQCVQLSNFTEFNEKRPWFLFNRVPPTISAFLVKPGVADVVRFRGTRGAYFFRVGHFFVSCHVLLSERNQRIARKTNVIVKLFPSGATMVPTRTRLAEMLGPEFDLVEASGPIV